MGRGLREDGTRLIAEAAIAAVARLLEAAGPGDAADRVAVEARALTGCDRALLVLVARRERRLQTIALAPTAPPPADFAELDAAPVLARAVRDGEPALLAGAEAHELLAVLGATGAAGAVLVLPLRRGDVVRHLLVLTAPAFTDAEVGVAAAFATAAAGALAQVERAAGRAQGDARHAALARAAASLTESLDPSRVLPRICEEAVDILDGDVACVYLGDPEHGLRVEATYGGPPELVGAVMEPGQGLGGACALSGKPMLTNDYASLERHSPMAIYERIRSCLAVPLSWDGKTRGALTVSYLRPHLVTHEHLALLEGFGELAAAACRNASAHAGLALAARTDALTGCLNHAAMHDTLRREIDRAGRGGQKLALAIVDLDDFKQVNERHGHLAGDEVLRRVGASLRRDVRTYDVVARYGGDEFAIVAIDADERRAVDVAQRAIDGIARAVAGLDSAASAGRATAGVAQWHAGESSTHLLARADATLMYGKQRGTRGIALPASELPDEVDPLSGHRAGAEPVAASGADAPGDRLRAQEDRLRLRTRQLAVASALGTRVAAMTEPREIIEAAVDEMHRAFGWYLCAILRVTDNGRLESLASRGAALDRLGDLAWTQQIGEGLIGRAVCERRPVVAGDVAVEPDYRTVPELAEVVSELVVPLWVGDDLWGAIDVEDVRRDAFDDDDVRLVRTVADQVGSALRSATLYEQLDSAYVGTAEALAAALEAKDARAAKRSNGVAEIVRAVGERLGLDARALRTLRLGAIFHDIGKVAIPQALLDKQGALTPAERDEVERHAVLGERILAPIEFLDEVRHLVRHEHERWDGRGYPDGLAGEEIPLGSRIILTCDAYDAMLAERPYRPAMPPEQARVELQRFAGTQFDPRVVAALLDVLDEREAIPAQAAVSESR